MSRYQHISLLVQWNEWDNIIPSSVAMLNPLASWVVLLSCLIALYPLLQNTVYHCVVVDEDWVIW